MKIEFTEVGFRNFLSYGDKWTVLSLKSGINFIVGDTENNERTNAIGKSSALIAITFALFGKSVKDVVKNDFINWQNGKKCQVYLKFNKDNQEYKIERGIKPNYFYIYKNDELQPQESDVRVAQKLFEENIIGWNIETFQNLIYCNPNNTISILNTSAQKKRSFIEGLFTDMEYFSNLMDKTKEKLRNIKDKKEKNTYRMSYVEENIHELNSEISSLSQELKNYNVSKLFNKYNDIKEKYDKLIQENEEIENDISKEQQKANEVEQKIKEFEEKQKSTNENINKSNWELDALNKEKTQSENNKEYETELENINQFIKLNDNIQTEIEELNNDIKEENEKYHKILQKFLKNKGDLENLEEQKKSLYPNEELKDSTKCPTCMSEISFDDIKKHFAKERKNIDNKINRKKKKVEDYKNNLSEITLMLDDKKEKYEKKYKIDNQLKEYKEKKKYLEKFLENSRSIEEIDMDIEEITIKIDNLHKKNHEYNNKICSLMMEKDIANFEISKVDKKQKSIDEVKQRLDKINIDYKLAKEKTKNIKDRISNKKIKIEKYEKEHSELLKNNKKLNNLNDYFEYLKETLKDKNIKSYIINIIIPYLNQRVNEYLSIIGFDFYVEFDDWLNVQIFGPGGRAGCKLGSMSGGEDKSIDIVTKLALMDISQMKSKIYPDILILDEMLDTSIDTWGIEKIMQVLQHKQKKDGLKVFIISHRKEINELTSDIENSNIYKIGKKNNFSYIITEV